MKGSPALPDSTTNLKGESFSGHMIRPYVGCCWILIPALSCTAKPTVASTGKVPVFRTVPTMFVLPSESTKDDWAIIFTGSSAERASYEEYAPVLNDKMTRSASVDTANICIV